MTPLPATGQDHPEAHVSASASSGVLFWRKAGKDCLEKKWALQPETGDGGPEWKVVKRLTDTDQVVDQALNPRSGSREGPWESHPPQSSPPQPSSQRKAAGARAPEALGPVAHSPQDKMSRAWHLSCDPAELGRGGEKLQARQPKGYCPQETRRSLRFPGSSPTHALKLEGI